MNTVLIIILAGSAIFLALGFFLIRYAGRTSDADVYRNQKLRIELINDLRKKNDPEEKKISTFKKIIPVAMQCRNLTQKISVQIDNLDARHISKSGYSSLDIRMVEDNLKNIDRIVKTITQISERSGPEFSGFTEQLMDLMNSTGMILKEIRVCLSGNISESYDPSHAKVAMDKNYASLAELHNNMINRFRQEFDRLQESI